MSARCEAAVEASMNCLVFDMGRLAIPSDTTLFSLLNQSYAKSTTIFAIRDSEGILSDPSSLERILGSIFDTTSRAFVTEKSLRTLAGLDDRDKACLFVQAAAGIAMILERLRNARTEMTPSLFSRELQLFAESDARRNMLDKIGASSLFDSCFTGGVMADFVMATIEGRETGHYENLPLGRLGEDPLSDDVAWISDRPCKNMGQPWGFTIMTIN